MGRSEFYFWQDFVRIVKYQRETNRRPNCMNSGLLNECLSDYVPDSRFQDDETLNVNIDYKDSQFMVIRNL